MIMLLKCKSVNSKFTRETQWGCALKSVNGLRKCEYQTSGYLYLIIDAIEEPIDELCRGLDL